VNLLSPRLQWRHAIRSTRAVRVTIVWRAATGWAVDPRATIQGQRVAVIDHALWRGNQEKTERRVITVTQAGLGHRKTMADDRRAISLQGKPCRAPTATATVNGTPPSAYQTGSFCKCYTTKFAPRIWAKARTDSTLACFRTEVVSARSIARNRCKQLSITFSCSWCCRILEESR